MGLHKVCGEPVKKLLLLLLPCIALAGTSDLEQRIQQLEQRIQAQESPGQKKRRLAEEWRKMFPPPLKGSATKADHGHGLRWPTSGEVVASWLSPFAMASVPMTKAIPILAGGL